MKPYLICFFVAFYIMGFSQSKENYTLYFELDSLENETKVEGTWSFSVQVNDSIITLTNTVGGVFEKYKILTKKLSKIDAFYKCWDEIGVDFVSIWIFPLVENADKNPTYYDAFMLKEASHNTGFILKRPKKK